MTNFRSSNYQGSRGAHEAAFFTEEQVATVFRKESLRQWNEDQRAGAAEVLSDDHCCKFLDNLSVVFQFLGACMEQRSAAMRGWVVLREFAPHFVEHETYSDAAARFGVTRLVLTRLRDDLRLSLPELVGKRSHLVFRSEQEKERHRFQQRERHKFLKRERLRIGESASL